ncbi:forkhead domain-containing protein [Cordyceps militaris CM01]|uniref:Forkhead domain-containing protein n=1 Tax=Cordyceps militaris (strain CM01) TaxID=983644 RepID=G3J7N4_CORMM|nr:forkhead domain-containing protein [Cordyceps militaris CM01]EGX95500.1 forkhead domain-containing protein [Cordyceps militaris CM01]
MKLASPSTSPRLIQNPSDIIKSEPITHLHLAKWKAEDDLMVKANRQTRDCSSSGPYYCQQQASDLDARKCEPMSPPDNYSITSSPQTFGWPPSSDSGESEPWTLHHHELLPDHSGYAKSPSSPASGWDCAVPYQFQSAPTSAGYFGDCGIPFTAATPPPMQASYSHSPVFEMASSYGSPHYPPSHFADGSPSQQQQQQQQRPMTCGDLGSLVHETTSHHEYSSAVMATPPSEYQDGSKGKNDINSLPYSQLLYRAFMSSNTRKLSLRQIYQWFEDNTNKAVNNKGWQNSIRHNLSMNRAFEKAPLKEDGTESRRATEWVLADWALQEGVQSTTRYRKGNIRSKSHGSERDRLANSAYSGGRRGVMGYSGRGRERHYSHRMAMHGLAPESHLVYGAAGPPPPPLPGAPPPGHLGTCSTGFPEVEGYMTAAAGGLCYSGMEVQEGYGGGGGGFAQQDESTSYNGYAMYSMGEGTAMGEYAIVGGVPDGTLAGTHVGGVVPPTSVGVQFGPQLSSTSSGLVMANEQHSQHHHYTHAEYDTRQGISLAPRGTHE